MKIIGDIREFWRINKLNYLWSCLILSAIGLFIGLIKQKDMNTTIVGILMGCAIMFMLGFVIGGNDGNTNLGKK